MGRGSGSEAATLNGEVNRNWLTTTYHFEYTTTVKYKTEGFIRGESRAGCRRRGCALGRRDVL